MAQKECIKHYRNKVGLNVSEIARRFEISWPTAKKYADCEDHSPKIAIRKRKSPIMGPYEHLVEVWLLEDTTKPKKQRHTAQRIFTRLRDEHGFTGSDRTVRAYVAKKREELKLLREKAYHRLKHPGGEAQVDFGSFEAIIDGEKRLAKHLVVTFPYSNAAFISALPAENAECFLEGLKRIFAQIGGVPPKLWFDNLSAAVVSKNGRLKKDGERQLTEAFRRFKLHYGFEAVFCNPGKGHEKGSVENKIGYTRRNWCVPIPVADSFEALQEKLSEKALSDLAKKHYSKGIPQCKLWEEERAKLLSLPLKEYEVFRIDVAKVNKYGEISLDKELMRIPNTHPGMQVLLKVMWDSVKVFNKSDGAVICTLPRSYMHQVRPVDWKAELEVFRDKVRPLFYSQTYDLLPKSIKSFLSPSSKDKREKLRWLLRMLHSYTLETIAEVLRSYPYTTDLILLEHFLYKHTRPEHLDNVVDSYSPPAIADYDPDVSVYDRLHGKEVDS